MIPFRSFCGFESWLDQDSENVQTSLINGVRSSKSVKKSTEACKSHKEAERRRRQRINDHLSTLRSLLPNATKSDKASLLGEVVEHLKRLRKEADDVANGYNDVESSSSCSNEPGSVISTAPSAPFPGGSDEASVSYCDGEEEGEQRRMKATVCCEDRPGLNRDLNRAILSVKGKPVRAEMMTVGGRTKSVVVVQCGERDEEKEKVEALERALNAVVEDRAFVGYRMGRVILGQKRARESYGSSSSEVDCSFLLGKEELL